MARKGNTLRPVGFVTVENPLASPSAPDEQKRTKAVRALRDDRLALLHHRGQINSRLFKAGRGYQALCEGAEIGGIAGQDLTRPMVDGGGQQSHPLSDRQINSTKELARLRGVLGRNGRALIDLVLLESKSLREIAQLYYSDDNRSTMIYIGKRFREALSTIAKELGYG